MREAVEMVAEFHKKYCFTEGTGKLGETDGRLQRMAERIAKLSRSLDLSHDDSLRIHLILEEVAELAQGMSAGQEVEVLDALADLCYVVVGTAVTFGLPLAEAFDEVHRSNMTKTIKRDRPGHPGKGRGYTPPDLSHVLEEHRDGQLSNDV